MASLESEAEPKAAEPEAPMVDGGKPMGAIELCTFLPPCLLWCRPAQQHQHPA
jgi:hypothetical protein